jgi:hypothetical protein
MFRFLPFDDLVYHSGRSTEEILSQLEEVFAFTESRNFWNRFTGTDLFTGSISGNAFTFSRRKYNGQQDSGLLVSGWIVSRKAGSTITVRLRTAPYLLACNLLLLSTPLLLWSLSISLLWLSMAAMLLYYLFWILLYNYERGWVTGFLERWLRKGQIKCNT